MGKPIHWTRAAASPSGGVANATTWVSCSACRKPVGPCLEGRDGVLPTFCPDCLSGTAEPALRLRSLRIAAGLSRVALAAAAGLTPRTLARYERGTATPRPSDLGQLIDVLTVVLLQRRWDGKERERAS